MVQPTPPPKGPLCTIATLAADFRSLGIKNGDLLLVHSSLSKIGWVNGGAESVILALLEVVGAEGTLIMPSFTGGNSDPAEWKNPPVPKQWWQLIRDTMPPFNPRTSRTRAVGVIPETFRTWPGVVRSDHPQTSFAAIGPEAGRVTSEHASDCCLGERSPLRRLEELGAHVLLLGVDFETCTAFHLAQYRISAPQAQNAFSVMVNGFRSWVTVRDVALDSNDFEALGLDFERERNVDKGLVGAAKCKVFSLSSAVAYAQRWLTDHRQHPM